MRERRKKTGRKQNKVKIKKGRELEWDKDR
jgi:hypothetical protein